MSRRLIRLVVLLAVALLVTLALLLRNGLLGCGSDQTWSLRRGGCWPVPAAY